MDTKFMTDLTHLGSKVNIPSVSNPKVPPIYMSSAYNFDDAQECAEVCYGEKDGYLYGSYGNPTCDCLREIFKKIEGGEDAYIYSSGMAAISLTIESQVSSGDHVIVNNVIYGNSFSLLKRDFEEKYGVEVSLVDFENDNLENHFKENTKLVYMETISNPLMEVLDIRKIAKISHQNNSLLVVDNTFASPIVCQPLKLGADIVVHSATKFLNGHSDIMAGVVVSNKENINKTIKLSHNRGPIISPFDAWLLLRSMRTLELRMNKHCSNAIKLAQYLETHKKVKKVYYPGLNSFKDNKIANEIFNNNNYGGMLAVDLGSYENINIFVNKCNLAKIMPSLGTYTTTICDTRITHSGMSAKEREEMGLPQGLLRINAGLENIDDIINEFDSILKEF